MDSYPQERRCSNRKAIIYYFITLVNRAQEAQDQNPLRDGTEPHDTPQLYPCEGKPRQEDRCICIACI